MLFNSFAFLLFFPIVCIVYYALPTLKLRNLFLLVASYYFYMNWEPVYALLLIASTSITYLSSIGISKYKKYKKAFVILSLVFNLTILFFFKYFNWAAENVTEFLACVGLSIHIPEFKVLLPVGISFYIFQALGYTMDVYYGSVKLERNFFRYALFVSFFPQLVAGPIERSTNLLQQFYEKHTFDGDRAIKGITIMLWGYFLKLVLADNLAVYVDSVYNGSLDEIGGGKSLLASIMFCFQLYGDFAGYSYIATGCSLVLGFRLMDNFLRPYFFSVSIQDFWRRNHISLTTWFMDYVYYPMVGSSTRITWWCFCIFFTFFLSGFWHGANWTYVVCFSIFGIYLVVCILKEKKQRRFEKTHHLKNKEWWLWINRFVTFCLVCFALIFFRANSLSDAIVVVQSLFKGLDGSLFVELNILKVRILYILILFIVEYTIEYKKNGFVQRHFFSSYLLFSISMILLILFCGNFKSTQFIYFQF